MKPFILPLCLLWLVNPYAGTGSTGIAQEGARQANLPDWLEGPWKVESIDITVDGKSEPDYPLRKTQWMMFAAGQLYFISQTGWTPTVHKVELPTAYAKNDQAFGRFMRWEGQPEHLPTVRYVATRKGVDHKAGSEVADAADEDADSPSSYGVEELVGGQADGVTLTTISYSTAASPRRVRTEYRLSKCDEVEVIYAATRKRTLVRQGGSAIPHLERLCER